MVNEYFKFGDGAFGGSNSGGNNEAGDVNSTTQIGQQTNEKTKNYFANNGIINCQSNDAPFKVYVTTCFLANRRLALKLGCKWGTAAKKYVFNAYTVNSDSILVIIEDTEAGKVIQAQCSKNKVVMACDQNDTVVNDKKYVNIINKIVMGNFDSLLQKTKEMCKEEDEFFASKTSKTYDRLRESKTNKNVIKINESQLKKIVAESVKRVLRKSIK